MSDTNMICCGCMKELDGQQTCPHCGTAASFENNLPALPVRIVLYNNYLIGKSLGNGGFGTTYLGLDLQLRRPVVIKEYLPRQIATRASNRTMVKPASRDHSEDFQYGLEKFSEEAQTLAKFYHPNIVPITLFFEENNTAYFVMPYIPGKTLEKHIRTQRGGLSERQLLDITIPVLRGLEEVHSKGLLHRDIKPQNLYIPDSGEPLLLDFGSARQYMIDKNRSFSVFLTPGYAPFEQYTSTTQQGPYTDIYACAATMYACLGGYNYSKNRLDPPISAPDRQQGAHLRPIGEIAQHDISERLNSAIMKGMALEPRQRPQTLQEFEKLLPKQSNIIPTNQNFELLGIAGEYENQRIPLSVKAIRLGKNRQECNLVFSEGRISREHCEIRALGGQVLVDDLNSTNGTWINDERVDRAKVRIGDRISLAGQSVFQVVEARASQPIQVSHPEPRPLIAQAPQQIPEFPPEKYAGFWKRLGAWFIDLILINTLATFLYSLLIVPITREVFQADENIANTETSDLITILIVLILSTWLYKTLLESSKKQATLGKAAIGIIVTDEEGKRLSFLKATGRHLAKTFSYLTIGIGFVMAGLKGSKKQALHDKMSGCCVLTKPNS